MNHTSKTVLAWLFLLCFFPTSSAIDIREDEISEKYVYQYALPDINRAKEIMRLLREQKAYPEYRLNVMEGDMYYNRADYFVALKYYKRALFDKEIEKDLAEKLSCLSVLSYCYFYLHNIPSTEYYTHELAELAKKNKDNEYLSSAIQLEGLIAHAKGNKEEAYKKLEESIQLEESMNTMRSRKDLLYKYLLLVEYQQKDSLNEQALQSLDKLRTFQLSKDSIERMNEPFDEVHKKEYYAHCTVIHQRLGHTEEAAMYYEKFKRTANMYQSDYQCIEPYLYDMKLYDDIIQFTEARKAYLRNIADTMNYEMISISEMSAKAYMAKGAYEKASYDYAKIVSLYERIKRNEEISAMSELTSIYEMKDKEVNMQRKVDDWKLKWLFSGVLILIIAAGVIIYRTYHYNKIITNKNRLMTERIDELMAYKEKFYKQERNIGSSENKDMEEQLFKRMQNEIIGNKLYLNPNLSREILLKKLNIPKNVFSSLFHDFAHTSFNQYINDLRLTEAVRLLKMHPNYTIDAVANECGFASAPTLYRLFSQKYGMTPSEYRKMLGTETEKVDETEKKEY